MSDMVIDTPASAATIDAELNYLEFTGEKPVSCQAQPPQPAQSATVQAGAFHSPQNRRRSGPCTRAAFERGSVDAWVTWDPYVAAVDKAPDMRILANGEGLASYQRYYLASSRFAAAHPDVINTLFTQLTSVGAWVRAHPDGAAKRLAPIWGLDAATIERANARRSYAVRAVDAQNFGDQQKIADTFYRAGLLPAPVDTGTALRSSFTMKRVEVAGASTTVSGG